MQLAIILPHIRHSKRYILENRRVRKRIVREPRRIEPLHRELQHARIVRIHPLRLRRIPRSPPQHPDERALIRARRTEHQHERSLFVWWHRCAPETPSYEADRGEDSDLDEESIPHV